MATTSCATCEPTPFANQPVHAPIGVLVPVSIFSTLTYVPTSDIFAAKCVLRM